MAAVEGRIERYLLVLGAALDIDAPQDVVPCRAGVALHGVHIPRADLLAQVALRLLDIDVRDAVAGLDALRALGKAGAVDIGRRCGEGFGCGVKLQIEVLFYAAVVVISPHGVALAVDLAAGGCDLYVPASRLLERA